VHCTHPGEIVTDTQAFDRIKLYLPPSVARFRRRPPTSSSRARCWPIRTASANGCAAHGWSVQRPPWHIPG